MLLKFFKGLIGGILGAIFGFFAGLIYGAYLGSGNSFKDFFFNGQRGYEAVGQIGAILGTILGAIAGILLALKIKKSRNRNSIK
jgi:gas vesicle protein